MLWIAVVLHLHALNGSSARNANADSNPLSGTRPNVILIVADDLGYGELGCYGQQRIKTPRLDRMAAEGLRFTDFYAGCTVCAPSRCVLMTGLHVGHGRIRANDRSTLLPHDLTIGSAMQRAGYRTAAVGKWGLGDVPSSSIPTRHGFGEFFGYLNNLHAHNYYPDFLWNNETKQPIEGNVVANGVATTKRQYSQDLFTQAALDFVDHARHEPFFLYLAYTAPHANNEAGRAYGDGMEVPNYGDYANQEWPNPEKGRAAMISRLDRDIGKLFDKLRERGVDERTIVLFTSDNGPHREGNSDPDFFKSAGPFRGIKRDLTEGGIRVPLLARWPGRIATGEVRTCPAGFWDVLPTLADLAGDASPNGLDGISLISAFADRDWKRENFCFYWEFHERGFHQAIRTPKWKAIRNGGVDADIQLYNLSADPGETRDRSRRHPEDVAAIATLFATMRTNSDAYPAQKRRETKPAKAKKAASAKRSPTRRP